jgi:soluble lytic murein transglycosylase
MYDGVERPISRARAAYWAGRAADAVVDRLQARHWYNRAASHPSTFYGQLALESLGETARTPPVVQASAAQRLAFESQGLVRVVRMLGAGQAWRDMRPFLVQLVDHAETPAEIRLIAELAAGFGRPELMVLVGKYASYAGFEDEAAAFPIPDYATLSSPPADFPELALVLAVARQESLFDPQAGSHAGARGLLQLMPSTARLVAKELRVPYNIGLLTGDPEYNLRLGGAYLRRVVDRYGDFGLALAAYNAGPSRVDGWISLHGDPRKGSRLDWVDWMELIPFDETRNYVQRVLENYQVYQRLLQEGERARIRVATPAGPIEPVPLAAIKPLATAGVARLVALGTGPIEEPPLPALKPVAGPVIIPAGFSLWPLPVFKPAPEDLADSLPVQPAPNPHG